MGNLCMPVQPPTIIFVEVAQKHRKPKLKIRSPRPARLRVIEKYQPSSSSGYEESVVKIDQG